METKLKKPFRVNEIEWRVQSSGKKGDRIWAKVLAYVSTRAIHDRLDEVCGVDGWANTIERVKDGWVAGIGILFDGNWIWKYDGSQDTDIEGFKGGISGAFKRAAVLWGIGRYLYNLPVGWANIHPNGQHSDKLKTGEWFKWDPPELPAWAISGDQDKNAPEPSIMAPEQVHFDKMMQDAVDDGYLTEEQYEATYTALKNSEDPENYMLAVEKKISVLRSSK